jgi:hypothetical protein
MRKRELAKEGINILDLYLRKSNNDKSPREPLWRATRLTMESQSR